MSGKQKQAERAARRAEKGEAAVPVYWRDLPLEDRSRVRKLPGGQSMPLTFQDLVDGIGRDTLARFSLYFSPGPLAQRVGHLDLFSLTHRANDPFGPYHTPSMFAVSSVPANLRRVVRAFCKDKALHWAKDWILAADRDSVGAVVKQARCIYRPHRGERDDGGLRLELKAKAERYRWDLLHHDASVFLPGFDEEKK